MTQRLYDSLAIPDSCHLGKRVFKKLFDENAELTAGDRKALADDVDTITWQYTLKPSTIQIPVFEDAEREYHEVAVLEAGLKGRAKAARLAEVIHRAIPYPVVLVLSDRVGLPTSDGTTAQAAQHAMLSLATKRLSRAEKSAIVADEFFNTDWLNLSAPTPVQAQFLASLSVRGLPHTNFLDFYAAMIDRVLALQASRLSGRFRVVAAGEEREARRRRLSECRSIELQIGALRAAFKAETHFNRQVELNTKIKALQKRLEGEVAGL